MLTDSLDFHDRAILRALDAQYVLYRQPIISLHDLPIRYEILLRDRNGNSGGRLVQEFESRGAIAMLDAWVFWQLFSYLKSSEDAAHYSINLSPISLVGDRASWLINFMWTHLRDAIGLTQQIGFEITERGSFDWRIARAESASFIRYLKGSGHRISLDDFGMGHSIFDMTHTIKPDCIKIDAFYVRDCINLPASRVVVESLIAIARAHAIEIAVEGIETSALLGLARYLQCDWAQGWAIAREEPLPPYLASSLLDCS